MNLRLFFATAALGMASVFATAQANADTVTCESSNGNYRECSVDTRGGVTLSRQLSSQGCWEGDTWGYDRNRIWVNNGCRAQFHVGSPSSSSSNNNGNAVAAAVAVGLIGAAIIASNKNKHDRDRDDYNNGGSWGNGGNPRNTFRCESQNNRYAYCSTGGGRRGQVEIYRQLSDRRCVYGQNWGTQGNQVWVNNGCRAEFAVY